MRTHMELAPELFVDFKPLLDFGGVPFAEVVLALVKLECKPGSVRALLEQLNRRLLAPVLRPQAVEDGGYLVEERVLVPARPTWGVVFQREAQRLASALDEESVPLLADFLRLATRVEDLERVREAWPFEDEGGWMERLFTSERGPEWPRPEAPGVYRREHACLVIRSRTTGILLDPIGLQRRMPNMGGQLLPRRPPPELVDATAITHGHVDHWHLPSVLASVSSPEQPVLVPRVPHPSVLTFEDFEASLRLSGQAVRAPAWGETVRVGDIEVDVLPFYGEQPLRDGPPLRAGLRNWGNCYRFNTEDFSCLVLVDSGADPEGRMEEVAAESLRRRGPVDVVLACEREFLSPFFGGLAQDWAALPWSRLQGAYQDLRAGRLRSSTAGPLGIAAVCAAAQARYFLPYANGYEGADHPITDVGWGEGDASEAHCNTKVREALARLGARTEVLEWRPGGVAGFKRGGLELRPSAR